MCIKSLFIHMFDKYYHIVNMILLGFHRFLLNNILEYIFNKISTWNKINNFFNKFNIFQNSKNIQFCIARILLVYHVNKPCIANLCISIYNNDSYELNNLEDKLNNYFFNYMILQDHIYLFHNLILNLNNSLNIYFLIKHHKLNIHYYIFLHSLNHLLMEYTLEYI